MEEQTKILIVDDEPKICHLIEDLLKQEGYEVDVSFSGIEALKMLKKDDYQMLLTDLKMPGIDGLELIGKAKKSCPDIRSIMVTGYATIDTAVQSLRNGVDDYITKPFNIFELKKAVKQTLHIHKVEMENMRLVKDLKMANQELTLHKQGLVEKVEIAGKQLANTNKELVKRVSELSIINEVSKAITSVLNLDEILNLCLSEINEKLKVKHSSIMLIDEKRERLIVKASQGYRSRQVLGATQGISEGVAGRVVVEKRAIMVKDITHDKRFNGSERSDYKTKSFVAVPLITEGRVLGVINIIDKESSESFCESDVNLLYTIAGQVSIALENVMLYEALEANCFNMVKSLAAGLDAKDSYTNGHSERVSEYSYAIGNLMGMSDEEKNTLLHASLLHDIGKIGISDSILKKTGKLNSVELDTIKFHPATGEKIIKPLKFLDELIPHIRRHHESFDGNGYPDGVGGEDLPLLTRIMTVADSFDAMTSNRTYRSSMDLNEAISELEKGSGTQFDPDVVDAFVSSEIIRMKSELEACS